MVGSMHNRLYERMTKGAPTPEPGMGATMLLYTDRHACTIIEVGIGPAKDIIAVKRDVAKRVDSHGMSDMQDYEYETDLGGYTNYFRMREGRWRAVRFNPHTMRWNLCGSSTGLLVGKRDEYHDFSF